jgi:hypothetical protein
MKSTRYKFDDVINMRIPTHLRIQRETNYFDVIANELRQITKI